MDDETIHITKEAPPSTSEKELGSSKIFNTSVRGWIALALTMVLGLSVLAVVAAPFFGANVESAISDQLLTLFTAGFGGAVMQYFNQRSKEGQK